MLYVEIFIFSSSATVYGNSKSPLFENSQVGIGITNPYGSSKFMIEQILKDLNHNEFSIINLRYFNPVGAHPSGLIGENPTDIPNNLMPFVLRVAIKNNLDPDYEDVYKHLNIFGNNYDSDDGTAVRDFIHVVDLAKAHIVALERLIQKKNKKNYEVFNLGTGKGNSVLEVINAFEKVTQQKLPYKIVDRREGDIIAAYADTIKANNDLGWKAELGIEEALKSAWEWQLKQD